jgi:hypothetical protein
LIFSLHAVTFMTKTVCSLKTGTREWESGEDYMMRNFISIAQHDEIKRMRQSGHVAHMGDGRGTTYSGGET